jgi:dihydroorotate dehydrogenase (NAD+) catalytic subunit
VARVKPRLGVDLGGLRLPGPVLAASGCLGTGREAGGLVELNRLGGIVTRTLTLHPERGGPVPRMAETPSGIVVNNGMQNPGVDGFLVEDLPRLARTGVPLIASVGGRGLEEFALVTARLESRPELAALEVALSSPDEELGGHASFAAIPERAAEVVGAVARRSRLPVFAKLPPLVPGLEDLARACVRGGAHGLTLIDPVPAMAVDAARLRPSLAAIYGGLSGPAIRPIALAAVHRVASELPGVPIMGVGGIAQADDAVSFLLAGAWAVQVGTALLVDPSAPVEIAQGILRHLQTMGFASPAELRGRLRGTDAEVR